MLYHAESLALCAVSAVSVPACCDTRIYMRLYTTGAPRCFHETLDKLVTGRVAGCRPPDGRLFAATHAAADQHARGIDNSSLLL